jgi:hypothetical protein
MIYVWNREEFYLSFIVKLFKVVIFDDPLYFKKHTAKQLVIYDELFVHVLTISNETSIPCFDQSEVFLREKTLDLLFRLKFFIFPVIYHIF